MRSIVFSIILISFCFMSGCGVYSFTGASLTPDIKTISIQTFYNNATLGPANMSVLFTEKIKDYYQKNTSLSLVNSNGDLQLEGFVADYTISPVSATSSGSDTQGDYSTVSRITITVNATYINTKDDEFDFDKRFSFFVDVDQSEDITSNEQTYAEEIFDQIILDIFNASIANW